MCATVFFFKMGLSTENKSRGEEAKVAPMHMQWRYLKWAHGTTIRGTERSGQAVVLGARSQSVALRSRRLSEAKVKNLWRNEKDREGWRQKKRLKDRVCKCMSL